MEQPADAGERLAAKLADRVCAGMLHNWTGDDRVDLAENVYLGNETDEERRVWDGYLEPGERRMLIQAHMLRRYAQSLRALTETDLAELGPILLEFAWAVFRAGHPKDCETCRHEPVDRESPWWEPQGSFG